VFLFDSHSNFETAFNRNYYPYFTNEEKKVHVKVIQLAHGFTFTMKLAQLAPRPVV
jgi:hypothetical protein